jgi:hypothetical protein
MAEATTKLTAQERWGGESASPPAAWQRLIDRSPSPEAHVIRLFQELSEGGVGFSLNAANDNGLLGSGGIPGYVDALRG